jgi:hypothetical protein
MTSNSKAEGRFGKQDFRYVTEEDVYVCPAGARLTYSFTTEENGLVLYRYSTNAYQSCAIKHRCTTGKERRRRLEASMLPPGCFYATKTLSGHRAVGVSAGKCGIGKWTPDIATFRANCRFRIMGTKDQHHPPCHSSLAMHRARMPNMLRKLTTPSTSRPRSRRLLLHCGFRNHSAFPRSLWEAQADRCPAPRCRCDRQRTRMSHHNLLDDRQA